MKSFGIKLILFIFSVTTVVVTFPVPKAAAQIAVTDPGTYAAIAANTAAIGLLLNNPADAAALLTIRGSETACQGIDRAEQISNTSDQLSNFSIIGGSSTEAVSLSARILALKTVLTCREAVLTALDTTSAASISVVGAQNFQKKQNELNAEITTLKTRVENLRAQQSASIKDVLKAVMVKIILNLNKNLTTELVNKMVSKYKISSYLEYGNALATQVYSMKYINENFTGDARQQMMIRSILQSSKFPEKIKTAQSLALSKAQEYTSSACQATVADYNSSNSSDFWECISKLGNENSSPQYNYFQAVDQANQAASAGQVAAAQEVSQSDGYAPPRDCSGSLTQQKQIDASFDAATAEVSTAANVSARLTSALGNGQTTTAEVAKAETAYKAAVAKLNALPKSTSSPIIDICKAIDSPAKFVADSIQKFLGKHLDEAADLKSDNLPFYANFLADAASNFLTNILTGGKSTSQVLKEAGIGALNGTLIGVSQTGTSGGGTTGTPTPPGGSFNLYVTPTGSTNRVTSVIPGQSYTLHADFSSIGGLSAKSIRMQGFASVDDHLITDAERQAGGIQYIFDAAAGSQYRFTATLTFFNSNPGDALTTSLTVPVSSVQGASTILPRGPQISFRGN